MKNSILAFIFIFSFSIFGQSTEKENIKEVKITATKCIKRKGYQIILKEVLSDSRCPEGVTCIWAGEVQIVVSLYQNKKFIEDKTITFSALHNEENADWFSSYLPPCQKKIKSIGVSPYPKEGKPIHPKDYSIKIRYLKEN